MSDVEKRFYRALLAADAVAVIISMAAGPLGHTAFSISAAVSAVIISLALILYSLYFWPRR